jgi:hypothetical protein
MQKKNYVQDKYEKNGKKRNVWRQVNATYLLNKRWSEGRNTCTELNDAKYIADGILILK